MAKAAQISFKDFRTRFATESACRKYMFEVRFPDGFVCPDADAANTTISAHATPANARTAVVRLRLQQEP